RMYVVNKWAEDNPQAVVAYGLSQRNRPAREGILATAIREWSRQDANDAMAWAEKLPLGNERQLLLNVAWQGLAEANPQAAIEKIKTLPQSQRQGIQDQIIFPLAEANPKAAMDLVLQDDRTARRGLATVLTSWAQQEPDAVVAWLESQQENVRKRPEVS